MTSEVVRHLLRLQSYAAPSGGANDNGAASDELGACTASCAARCNPHKEQVCRKACRGRCKHEATIGSLLQKLARKGGLDDGRETMMSSHVRRHYKEAHSSHRLLAARYAELAAGRPLSSEQETAEMSELERAQVEHEALYAKHTRRLVTHTAGRESMNEPGRPSSADHNDGDGASRTPVVDAHGHTRQGEHHSTEAAKETAGVARRDTPSSGGAGMHPMAVPLVLATIFGDATSAEEDEGGASTTNDQDRTVHLSAEGGGVDGGGRSAGQRMVTSTSSERRWFDGAGPGAWRWNRKKIQELQSTMSPKVKAAWLADQNRGADVASQYALLTPGWSVLTRLQPLSEEEAWTQPYMGRIRRQTEPTLGLRALRRIQDTARHGHPLAAVWTHHRPLPSRTSSKAIAHTRQLNHLGMGPHDILNQDSDVLHNNQLPTFCMNMFGEEVCTPFPPNTISFELIPGFLAFNDWSIAVVMRSFEDSNIMLEADPIAFVSRQYARLTGNSSDASNTSTTQVGECYSGARGVACGGLLDYVLQFIANISLSGTIVLGIESEYSSPLTLNMRAVLFNEDMDRFTLQAVSWTPLKALPALTLPGLRGELEVYKNGTFVLEAATYPFSWTAIPFVLQMRDTQVALRVRGDAGSPPNSMQLMLLSDVLIGGEFFGFTAFLNGTVDVLEGWASLNVKHDGGWSPLPGLLGEYISTPEFNGLLEYNVGTKYVNLEASVTLLEPINFIPGTDLVRISNMMPSSMNDQQLANENCYRTDEDGNPLTDDDGNVLPEGWIRCCVDVAANVRRCELEPRWVTRGPTISIGYSIDKAPDLTPYTICDTLFPQDQPSYFPEGCTCTDLTTRLGGKIICAGYGLPEIPLVGIPEIPLTFSAMLAPCAVTAWVKLAVTMQLPEGTFDAIGAQINSVLSRFNNSRVGGLARAAGIDTDVSVDGEDVLNEAMQKGLSAATGHAGDSYSYSGLDGETSIKGGLSFAGRGKG